MTTQYAKPPLEPFQWAKNGQYPDSFLQNELADLGNKIALYRGKEIFRYYSHSLATGGPNTDERVRWRFAFRASPYCNAIGAVAWMAQTDPESDTFGVYSRLRIQDSTPTTLGDAEFHYGYAATASANLDVLSPVFQLLTNSGSIADPVAGTEYFGTVSDFQGRIVAISVFEMSINNTAPFTEGYAQGTPILDTDRQTLTAGARLLWKQGAAHLMNWTVDIAGTPRTRSSGTFVNAIDNSSTAISAASPGFTLDLRNRSTVRRGTVPVTFRVYGSAAAGTGGRVHLMDSSSTSVAFIDNITTAGWYSATANLPATLAKYDLMYAGDGTNVFSFMHASLYQYTTGT